MLLCGARTAHAEDQATAQAGGAPSGSASVDATDNAQAAPASATVPPPSLQAPPTAPTPVVATAPSTSAGIVPVPTNPEPLPAWIKNVTLGGGFILWYYQPLELAGAKNNLSLFFANLLIDVKSGIFGLHIEPRFRDTKLRAFFEGPSWVQEVYGSVALGEDTVLKVGKAYSHLGLFWDNSFYGNVQVYDGLKLDPDYGLSLEGAVNAKSELGLRYWAQFFLVDGQTNVALQGRETFSLPGSRRRNQAILRLEPFYKQEGGLQGKVGLSGEVLQSDLANIGKKNVQRGALDLSVGFGGWSLWAEYLYQHGQSIADFPAAGTSSAHNHYGLAGTQLAFGKVTARYNVSFGRYSDVHTTEWMHVPALSWTVSDNLTLLGEFVHWKRHASGGDTLLDRSVDVTLAGHF